MSSLFDWLYWNCQIKKLDREDNRALTQRLKSWNHIYSSWTPDKDMIPNDHVQQRRKSEGRHI